MSSQVDLNSVPNVKYGFHSSASISQPIGMPREDSGLIAGDARLPMIRDSGKHQKIDGWTNSKPSKPMAGVACVVVRVSQSFSRSITWPGEGPNIDVKTP